ncbi:peptidoglycan-binding protein [Frankia sp. AgB1.9]|uniref:efflux RND transporter periplasmic adaptor subunit n=1 Tax=unclassified Frankia TaxID=2632575 RepID=UPI00193410F8|nr:MULTISPECIES: peptidoglycan-binding protein [unclassified Frankia]MBL7489978.1 peptidoglycan-binding protein [Frankia sp. AgW1.1]MBL7553154.1 peptidoglycan-binding protein [Frankia sp. AgB1.9]MBL7622203.1 peptidoglycan-binding protein [Frankia sp. AgB1.8]
MTAPTTDPVGDVVVARASAAPGDGPRHQRRRRRGRRIAVAAALVAAAAFVVDGTQPHGVSFAHPLGQHEPAHAAGTGNAVRTSTATVTRRALAARTSLNGTLAYAGDYTVGGQAHGTVTWLPSVGQTIHQGEVLYRVDGVPVVLLNGSTPAYRDLADGTTGPDVAQLNGALAALGYGRAVGLDPSSDRFGRATKAAVQKLQKALGVEQTGRLGLGQVVFLPTSVRVTALTATPGGQAGEQLFTGTSTTRQVTVDLDAARQSQLRTGDQVTITLPTGRTTPGTVISVGTVATIPDKGSTAAPTVKVAISPTDAAATGTLDQAPVQVAVTTDTVRNALVVPVTALLALAGGGYAVEVVATDGTHKLLPVTLGLFDDAEGLVQVTGAGLAAGQHVVVPAS